MFNKILKLFSPPPGLGADKSVEIERELARRYLDELSKQLTTSWTIYIQFYTVFLTANVLGLGLTVEKIDKDHRWPVVLAFTLQNCISFVTALVMAKYSVDTSEHFQELSNQMTSAKAIPALKKSPIAGQLGWWAGIANAITHIGFGVAWVFVLYIGPADPNKAREQKREIDQPQAQPTYQWQKDGTNISGATSTNYTISSEFH
jgi:hypothetical protein